MKLFYPILFLLCRNNMCSMWHGYHMGKVCKIRITTNILNFLETVYPTEESHPDYICIDKACLVLQTAIANGSWDANWKNTSRFIVDAYHYINHRATDYLCQKWCNPAPQDGSAPNLVVVSTDNRGQRYLKHVSS